jgi:hypothetical protein
MSNISKEDVGNSYGVATSRMHRLVATFYEDLFNRDGNPKKHPSYVVELTQKLRQQINFELDLVREASNQYYEAHAESEAEGLFGLDGKSS